MNQFYKGRTRNHATFVMVDATDFATTESALSAAMKVKIWGKLRADSGVYFVSSGAGSMAGGDVKHVGPSVLGIYTVPLAKADLSDASAAWYDQYIISLSATGAAYQTLVIDGGIDASAILAAAVAGSSRALLAQSLASDAHSAAAQANSRVLLTQSLASDAASAAIQANSRVLLVQSRLSDFDSRLVSDISDVRSMLSDMLSDFQSRVPKRVATDSQLSDLHSDLRSYLVGMSGMLSDAHSAAILAASNASEAQSQATMAASRALLNQSRISDVQSYLIALSDALSDAHSDLASKIGGITATLSASDISDIASAVWADTIGARVDSRVLLIQSRVSDLQSHLSDLQSDFQSRVPKRVATDSQLSDVHSDLKSAIGGITVSISASDVSDIASAVVAALPITSLVSDAHSAAEQANSRILLVLSRLSDFDSRLVSDVSDVRSMLSDMMSDFQSRVPKRVATDSQVSDLHSDLRSYLVGMSDMLSNTHSAAILGASHASDAHSAANAAASRALLIQSTSSDIYSLLSDVQSDFQSRVPKRVATDSQLSDLHSDLKSHLTVSSGVQSDMYSLLSDLQSDFQSRVPKAAATASALALAASVISDAHSAASQGSSRAAQAASRALLNQSGVSDIYSLLSDLASDVTVMSGVLSDVYSAVGAGVAIGASDMSDLRSAIAAHGVLRAGTEPAGVIGHTDTLAAKVDWLTAQSRNKQTLNKDTGIGALRNDADNDNIASRVDSDDGTTYTKGEWA